MNDTSNLFSLTHVLGDQYQGYWINADLTQVYSTKRGLPYALTKTGTGNCRSTYWSLSTGARWGSTTYRADDLAAKVGNHAAFIAWKTTPKVVNATPSATRGFIVGAIFQDGSIGSMSFSSSPMGPKVHPTAASAKVECERLATVYPGQSYAYFEIKGVAKFGGIAWN